MRAALSALIWLLPITALADASLGKPVTGSQPISSKEPTTGQSRDQAPKPTKESNPPAPEPASRADTHEPRQPPECGTYGWQKLHDAVVAHCGRGRTRSRTEPCRFLHHAFSYCSNVPQMHMHNDPPGSIVAFAPDARSPGHAWFATFRPTANGYAIADVHYDHPSAATRSRSAHRENLRPSDDPSHFPQPHE